MAASKEYTIKKGDTLAKIAKANNFVDYEEIWLHSANKALKSKRGKPNKIQPGDVLKIPTPKFTVAQLNAAISESRARRDMLMKIRAAYEKQIKNEQAVVNELSKQATLVAELCGQNAKNLLKHVKDIQDFGTKADWAAIIVQLTIGIGIAAAGARTSAQTTAKLSQTALKSGAQTEKLLKLAYGANYASKSAEAMQLAARNKLTVDIAKEYLGFIQGAAANFISNSKGEDGISVALNHTIDLMSPSYYGFVSARLLKGHGLKSLESIRLYEKDIAKKIIESTKAAQFNIKALEKHIAMREAKIASLNNEIREIDKLIKRNEASAREMIALLP